MECLRGITISLVISLGIWPRRNIGRIKVSRSLNEEAKQEALAFNRGTMLTGGRRLEDSRCCLGIRLSNCRRDYVSWKLYNRIG